MTVWKGRASLGLVLGSLVMFTASLFYPSAAFCVIREAPRTTVDEAFAAEIAAGHISLAGYSREELDSLFRNLRDFWVVLDQQKGPSDPDTKNVRLAFIVLGREQSERQFPADPNILRAERDQRVAARNASEDQRREARAKELLEEVRAGRGQGPSTG